MADPTPINQDTMLGKLIVEQGLASAQDVQDCIALWSQSAHEAGHGSTLAEVFVSNGLVTQRQLDRVRPMLDERRTEQQIPGYQIVRPLGAGAMAKVYLAKQL